jgi:serine protease Do
MKKFLAFVIFVFLCVAALYQWRAGKFSSRSGNAPQKYTPATESLVNLKDVQLLAQLDREITEIIKTVVPSVVSITTSRRVQMPPLIDPLERFFGRRQPKFPESIVQSALGSGVIISKEGHVVTNTHLIANYDEIRVQFTDGRTEPATLIGADADTDIALLRIDPKGIEPLPLGNSDEVNTGQIVFAIGNPFGFQETVTQGIISATGRRIQEDSGIEFFQTDTAINQGNSGGPLVNIRGEIIGINTAIFSGSGSWLGVSFAIPSNVVAHVVESLIEKGRVVRGYLGVGIQAITPELKEEFALDDTKGALVSFVEPGSPSAQAGMKPGDVIKSLDEKEVADVHELKARILQMSPGDSVRIGIVRNGKAQVLKATIAEAGNVAAIETPHPETSPSAGQVLSGIQLVPDSARAAGGGNSSGVVIRRIAEGAPAGKQLNPGDIIEELNRHPVSSVAEFERLARSIPAGENALLSVRRGNTRMYVVIGPQTRASD